MSNVVPCRQPKPKGGGPPVVRINTVWVDVAALANAKRIPIQSSRSRALIETSTSVPPNARILGEPIGKHRGVSVLPAVSSAARHIATVARSLDPARTRARLCLLIGLKRRPAEFERVVSKVL